MSDNIQQTNTNNQTINNDENKKNKEITFNYQPSRTGSASDITDNKIVVLDYTTTGKQIILNFNLFDNLNTKTIFLHKLNISYEDIFKTFKGKLMTIIVDGKYIMSDKDAINLDKMIGFTMSESEKNNKKIRTTNSILQNKYGNYDCIVKECNRFKSEMNKIKINLCLALSRRFNDKEDVMHLTNVCAALAAREKEYHYIQIENDKLKYLINEQQMNIRLKTLYNYDEILQSVENFKEELYIKDLKIIQLKDDLILLRSINEEKIKKLQLFHKSLSENFPEAFEYSQNNSEIYEAKILISKQIDQIQGSSDIEPESHQLCDLIKMYVRLTADKEERLKTINRQLVNNIEDKHRRIIKEIDDHKQWKICVENENEKLISEIKNMKQVQSRSLENFDEYHKLKKEYSKIKLIYDELIEKDAYLLTLLDDYRQRLTGWDFKCVYKNNLIKKLQSDLNKETNKIELANEMYKSEKCRINDTSMLQMIDEFMVQLHEKEIEIALARNECYDKFKHRIKSEEDYINNLNCEIITLEDVLNEKNNIIQDIKAQSIQQLHQHTAMSSPLSSLLFDNRLHINNRLEKQMEILLDNICTCQNIIAGYEKTLYNLQHIVQHQIEKINYRTTNYEHLKDFEYKTTLMENVTNEKKVILLNHQNEIEDVKRKYDSKIAHMAEIHVNLRNEIRDLKESLKLKNAHQMIGGKIAYSQLKESLTTVQQLTNLCNVQSSKLNDNMEQYGIPETCRDTHLSKTTNNQLESLVDNMLKVKSKNKLLKIRCKLSNEQIRSLENCRCKCTRTSATKY